MIAELSTVNLDAVLGNMNELFYRPDVRDEINNSEVQMKSMLLKPEVVHVYRYVRNYKDSMQFDPRSGLCILCVLDFNNREIMFSWSLCDGDNFSKEVSRNIAMDHFSSSSARYFSVQMPSDSEPWIDSLTELFVYGLPNSKVHQPVRRFLKLVQPSYVRSS